MILSHFVKKAMAKARYKLFPDSTYFGSIPGLRGVWANEDSLEDCRDELQAVLEDWLLIKLRNRGLIPGLRLPNLRLRRLQNPVSHHA